MVRWSRVEEVVKDMAVVMDVVVVAVVGLCAHPCVEEVVADVFVVAVGLCAWAWVGEVMWCVVVVMDVLVDAVRR